MKRIITLLLCCCLLFCGCAEFAESEKQHTDNETDQIKETFSELSEKLDSAVGKYHVSAPLSRSIYDTEENALYNPYCDFGFKLPCNWVVLSDEVYVDNYGYARKGIIEADDDIIKGDIQVLEKLSYIPDYIIYDNDADFINYIEVNIHNIAADEAMDGLDLSHDDYYAQINLQWLELLDYTDVSARDDIYIGNQRYKAVFGRSTKPDDIHYRLILSRIAEEGYVLNIDYISYSPDIYDMYDLSDYIFNSETQPQLVKTIESKITDTPADAPSKDPAPVIPSSSSAPSSPSQPVGSNAYTDGIRSIFDEETYAFYNPYLDFGIDVPSGFSIADDEYYLKTYYNLSDEDIEALKNNDTDDLPYIPEYFLFYEDDMHQIYVDVYIHNLSATENHRAGSMADGSRYAKLNMDKLKKLGYENVAQYDDIEVGDHKYQTVYGFARENGEFKMSRTLLSHYCDKNHVINVDIMMYNSTYYNYIAYNIFNRKSNPSLAEKIKANYQ